MTRASCFSHATAAMIYGMSLPQHVVQSEVLHVSALEGGRAPRGRGVVGHKSRLTPDQLRLVEGLRVPQAEEVFCQLAASLTPDELVVAGDSCLRRKRPLSTLSELHEAVRAAVGRPGARTLRAVVPQLRADTDSAMETVIRLHIVRAGLQEPVVNRPIRVASGIELHGDLVYPEAKVVIEYDGDHHRTDPAQYFSDVNRLWALENAGWRVVRINRSHLHGGASVAVARIRAALELRGRNTPF
ncbi:endonuclease domain-containing protein [Leifsonia sp. NPDC056824]|uniref:endonuclease domain-containing protein n=1 Tax=Leifsonia sp. NPDC056824 TaxID=3345953 RepID=UPI0036B473F3